MLDRKGIYNGDPAKYLFPIFAFNTVFCGIWNCEGGEGPKERGLVDLPCVCGTVSRFNKAPRSDKLRIQSSLHSDGNDLVCGCKPCLQICTVA